MEQAKRIRLLVMDVDGVLTDGRIVLDSDGRELKCFNVRDGLGLSLARLAGIQTAVVTGRSSAAVRRRAEELNLTRCLQGVSDKKEALLKLLQELEIAPEETAYVGDDLNDLAPMSVVGLPVAVNNAAEEVVQAAAYRCQARGGHGAVREVVELILKSQGRWEALIDGLSRGGAAQ